jgi:hypothetical protein
VLSTDQAPVSCPNVQVLFSTDGGLTFPTVLLASTPNDGIQSVQLPNVNTTQGRIKIQALNNVFFAINNANITLAGPLSVELTAFTAEAHGPTAHLSWHTASEKNNAGFAIETSADGTIFRRLGWVPGPGSSSTPRSYQFDDVALATYPGPTVYYRLRQVDNNGPESLSPVRAVHVPASAVARLQMWPNPAAGTVTVTEGKAWPAFFYATDAASQLPESLIRIGFEVALASLRKLSDSKECKNNKRGNHQKSKQ